MTPDQMNVDALLQSGQYLNQTMSTDGGSTTDFGRTGDLGTIRSTEFSRTTLEGEEEQEESETHEEYSRHLRLSRSEELNFSQRSGDYGTQSAEFGTQSRELGQHRERNGVRTSGTFGRSGRLTYTTSEFGQTESEYHYTGKFSENGERQELQASGNYPDSLEGTAEINYSEGAFSQSQEESETTRGSEHSPASRSGPRQVSVTIPSMAQSDSGTEDGGSGSVEDVSEISLVK